MRIDAVHVTGFRALKNVCVRLDRKTTVLVGENNTGKSAFLEALDVAIGTRQPVPDDLHVDAMGKKTRDFLVDLLLVPEDGKRFTSQLARLLGNAVRRDGQDNSEYVVLRTEATLGEDRSTVNRRRCFVDGWRRRPNRPTTKRPLSQG